MKLRVLAAGVLAVAAASFGCARPGAPTGGVRDVRPPVVIATTPEPNSTIEDLNPVVRFKFNERISERPRQGTMDDAVLVSPRPSGAIRVKHGSDGLEVSVEGGLRPGVVYRFTIQPVITDLFNNAMRDPFELVVSTGAPFLVNVIAGQVLDRVTGRGLPNADVQLQPAAPVPDTLLHVTRADANGLFVFRYVPQGRYNVVAFLDRNRNLAVDRASEPSGQRVQLLEGRADTAMADVVVVEPDTTRARVLRGEVVDSVTLRVTFDDYLDPEPLSLQLIAASVVPPEGRPIPSVTEVLHPAAWEARRDSAQRAANPEARAGPQSRVPTAAGVVAAPGQERGGLPLGVPLPRQDVVVILGSPLEPGVAYRVTVTGVVNLRGLPGGGGEATVTRAIPRPVPAGPASAPPDSAAAKPDSTGVPPQAAPPR